MWLCFCHSKGLRGSGQPGDAIKCSPKTAMHLDSQLFGHHSHRCLVSGTCSAPHLAPTHPWANAAWTAPDLQHIDLC